MICDDEIGVFTTYAADLNSSGCQTHFDEFDGTYENIVLIKKKGRRIHINFLFFSYGRRCFKKFIASLKQLTLGKQCLDISVTQLDFWYAV